MGTFVKGVIREFLISGAPMFEVSRIDRSRIENTVRRIERVIWDLTEGLTVGLTKTEGVQKRITNCYHCKRHLNSWDFALCKDCGWILCSCGACRCSWES